jgi:hypothetical protein
MRCIDVCHPFQYCVVSSAIVDALELRARYCLDHAVKLGFVRRLPRDVAVMRTGSVNVVGKQFRRFDHGDIAGRAATVFNIEVAWNVLAVRSHHVALQIGSK